MNPTERHAHIPNHTTMRLPPFLYSLVLFILAAGAIAWCRPLAAQDAAAATPPAATAQATDPSADVELAPVPPAPLTPEESKAIGAVFNGDWKTTFGSIGAIVLLSIGLTQLVKRVVRNMAWAAKVPAVTAVIAFATGGVLLGRYALGTLTGSLPALLATAILSAAAASGAYEWGRKPLASLRKLAVKPVPGVAFFVLIGLLGAAMSCAGCVTHQLSTTQRYQLISNAYAATVDGLATAVEAGYMTPEQAMAANPAVRDLNRDLDQIHARLAAGEKVDLSDKVNILERKMGILLDYQAKAAARRIPASPPR